MIARRKIAVREGDGRMGKRLALVGALLVNLVAAMLLVAAPASAASTTTVVSQSNLQGWGFYNDTDDSSRPPDFVGGPGTPLLGTGSAHLAVDSTGREILATGAYAGTKLADISDLSIPPTDICRQTPVCRRRSPSSSMLTMI